MKHTRWIKVVLIAVVVIGAFAISLAMLNGTSEAGGPGNGNGQGQGPGGNGGGAGQGGNGRGQNGQQIQDGTGVYDPLGDQAQNQGGYGQRYGGLDQQGGGILVDLPPATPGELPDDVIAALVAGITDEYHAYDIYGSVIAQFGNVAPFTNIQRSEQSHINALAFLFERYGLDVPEPDAAFVAPQFVTLEEACAAGAAAEIANYELYDEWLATVAGYPDLVQVFTALRDASQYQHLPAFERCAG